MKRLTVSGVGNIRHVDVTWGDLTVFVGSQVMGQSTFLQLLKLLVDWPWIRNVMRSFGLDWNGQMDKFLELYFGEGMSQIYSEPGSEILVDDHPRKLSRLLTEGGKEEERVFYIPNQRGMSPSTGSPLSFMDYQVGAPFVVRDFGEKLRRLIQDELPHGGKELSEPFPRLLELANLFFDGLTLWPEMHNNDYRLVLRSPANEKVPFPVWPSSMRESAPLLMGLYQLMPPGRKRHGSIKWVVIEEPEKGLPPNTVKEVMVLIMNLLGRGYQICLTTHSTVVLDAVWALQNIKEFRGTPQDVLRLFSLQDQDLYEPLAKAVRGKRYRVYLFKPEGSAVDISGLDPGSESPEEANWGGVTEFGGRAGDVVAEVVRRYISF